MDKRKGKGQYKNYPQNNVVVGNKIINNVKCQYIETLVSSDADE